MQNLVRPIKATVDHDIITIHTEFGYDIKYKLNVDVLYNPDMKEEDGIPFFSTGISPEYLETIPTVESVSVDKINKAIKSRSLIPEALVYDRVYLGFTYSTANDPNNHKWWLDFRTSNDASSYHIYADKIKITAPFTTTSWYDGQYWHGRFVINKDMLNNLLYKDDYVVIMGESTKMDLGNVCSTQDIPKDITKLRLRFSIKNNLWYCDFLKKDNTVGNTVATQSILCDAPGRGERKDIADKPRISMNIDINDISSVSMAINALIIRGK